MQAPNLSETVARHIANTKFDHLPAETRAAAARALLDGLGVMLGASASREAQPFVELARSQQTEAGALVLGHGLRTNAVAAALANGAMAHVLDFEDAFDAAPCHPNASLLPAALAIAGANGPVSGEELLTAIAVGCDLSCRLALSLRQPMEEGGWYPPPILGAFGATAAAAKLLRLDPRQTLDALSLVLGQNSCPGEIKYSPATVIRAIREAFPAQAAVTSVLLARQGVRGFEQVFEGRAGFFRLFAGGQFEPADILGGLGEGYWIERLTFKRWPCCRGTHAYIEGIGAIRRRRPFDWREVREARLVGGDVQRMLADPVERKRQPATAIDAKFSIPFTAAVALVRGDVRLDDFEPAALADPDVLAAAQRVTFVAKPDWGRDMAASGEIELEFANGETERELIPVARGHPDRPLGEAELRAKFVDCAGRAAMPIAAAEADMLADRVLDLPQAADASAWLAGTIM